jgi:lipoprotein NlpD
MLMLMNGTMRWLLAAGATAALAACSTVVVEPAPGAGGTVAVAPVTREPVRHGGSYQVAKGDTLYSIAFRNGVDFRDLARWNGIDAPYTIWPGQVLRLSPGHAPAPSMASERHAQPRQAAPAPPAAPVFEPMPSSPATAGRAPAVAAANPAVAAPGAAKTVEPARATSTTVPVAGEPVRSVPPPASTAPVVSTGGSRSAGGVVWHWPVSGSLLKRFQAGDAIPGIEIAGKAGDPVRAAADGVVVYSGNGLVGYGELIIIKHNDSFLSAYGHNRKRLVTEGQHVKAGQQIAEMGSTGTSRDELEFQIRKDGNPVDPLDYLPSR